MNNLGFTFYPSDWWSSDTFFEFTEAFERYVFLECLFIMYRNGGYMKTQKTQFENRIRIPVSDEVWAKVTAKFIEDENGFTSLTVNKRLKKALISRENGKFGGRPKKEGNPENPTSKPNIKEIESKEKVKVIETNDDILSDWMRWGKMIVDGRDQYWEQMRGRKITESEMDKFISVSIRYKWKMETANEFRYSLKTFEPLKFGNIVEKKNTGKIQ